MRGGETPEEAEARIQALVAARQKKVDDAALAERQRNSAQLRAQGVQANRSRTDVEPLSRVRGIPGLPSPPSLLPPKANAGRRRRSRKTRRYARRTR